MLTIIVTGDELFDEETETFATVGDIKVELEHSLISLSKWESEFEKPFLGPGQKSSEEVLGYIRAMILTPNLPPDILQRMTHFNLAQINKYIDSKQSATTFPDLPKTKGRREIITAELIYFWMVSYSIPFECENWHLNRLFSLLRVCDIKNSKKKKIPRNQLAAQRRELNAQRRAQLGTTG